MEICTNQKHIYKTIQDIENTKKLPDEIRTVHDKVTIRGPVDELQKRNHCAFKSGVYKNQKHNER